jgi:SsrA-binding protein
MPILAKNKRANFDYHLLEKYEAGLVLFGQEVKSAKAGQANLSGSYIIWKKEKKEPELYLIKAQISPYRLAGKLLDYNPQRDRKLLLTKKELNQLIGKTQTAGLTLIPVKMYTKRGLIKLELALAKGKKKYDKREDLKKKELDRQTRTLTKKQLR